MQDRRRGSLCLKSWNGTTISLLVLTVEKKNWSKLSYVPGQSMVSVTIISAIGAQVIAFFLGLSDRIHQRLTERSSN